MKLTSHFKHGHLADRRGKKGGVDDIIEHNYRPGLGFSGDASGKEPPCQCRRHKRCGFSPWVGKILWRRAWQPTVSRQFLNNIGFLPGESHGQRNLVSYCPWGHKESDMT